MKKQFDGKVSLVTGGASGIGRETALAFARDGAKVAVVDVDIAAGEQTARMIQGSGGEAIFVRADVSLPEQAEAMVIKAIQAYGRLDYAFNNAGIEGELAPTADCTVANWERVININLKGVWLSMKYEIPSMLKQGGGCIVNNSSAAGLVGLKGMSVPAYIASKHGVVGLTKAAALDYASSGIRVNAVCPNLIRTPMLERFIRGDIKIQSQLSGQVPVGRLGAVEEVAGVVIWLCSGAASFITGHALPIDGGYIAQ